MESPPAEEVQLAVKTALPIITARDEANAKMRAAIAARFEEEYLQCLSWAESAFGPGWEPSGRHYLLDQADEDRCRMTGERPTPAATVYTVRKGGQAKHFSVVNGQVVEHASYKEGFGAMLDEPHPTMTIEVRGQQVHPHRFSTCWAPIELYHPRTAEELAKLRESRFRKKAEREEHRWREENPLFVQAGYSLQDFLPDQHPHQ